MAIISFANDLSQEAQVREWVSRLLIAAANVLDGRAHLCEAGNSEMFGETRAEFILRSRYGVLFDSSRLSTEKRLALAVLPGDPGAANALADYLQEIGVIPKPDTPMLIVGRDPKPRDEGRPYSDSW